MNKVRWGVLGTAKIAVKQVIPAMQKGMYCEIIAIASRNLSRAQKIALELTILKAYGSYQELLDDPDIDAIYIPLPNHLHVPWAIKALEAGKHVLCEKPIGLSGVEALKLFEVARTKPRLKIMEAFMYRVHPQWQYSKKLVHDGRIGNLQNIHSFFSYHNIDSSNIRNKPEYGGGGLMDIGCYCVSLARFLFDAEPERVQAHLQFDPIMKTDRIASGILDFNIGSSTFTCSTQLMPYQRVNILGDAGRVEIEIPFNAPFDKITRIWHYTSDGKEEITFKPVDQYTIQGDLFSKSIIDDAELPNSLLDAINNMKVIDALIKSAAEGIWIKPA
jgi:predicted dehydrogenase